MAVVNAQILIVKINGSDAVKQNMILKCGLKKSLSCYGRNR